jgi:molybdate transport system substrate-binding protein
MQRRRFGWALAALAVAACFGCAREDAHTDSSVGDAGTAEREVVVFAASSLQDAFTRLEASFRTAHPGVEVKLSFAGTQQLRTQVEHGASFDVFAAADSLQALALARANHLAPLTTFAENEPVVVVAPDAASRIERFGDLPKIERLVVGAPEVPIGRYTLEVLERASTDLGEDFRRQVEARIVSRELNVRQVLAKVMLGEAQAGVVYRSDALSAKTPVRVLEIPREYNVVARYPIAVAVRATHPRLARAWVDHVTSPAGRAVLTAAGFRVPEKSP